MDHMDSERHFQKVQAALRDGSQSDALPAAASAASGSSTSAFTRGQRLKDFFVLEGHEWESQEERQLADQLCFEAQQWDAYTQLDDPTDGMKLTDDNPWLDGREDPLLHHESSRADNVMRAVADLPPWVR